MNEALEVHVAFLHPHRHRHFAGSGVDDLHARPRVEA
jgi:hypothetical protein